VRRELIQKARASSVAAAVASSSSASSSASSAAVVGLSDAHDPLAYHAAFMEVRVRVRVRVLGVLGVLVCLHMSV